MADEIKLNVIQRGLLKLFGLRPEDLPGRRQGELEMSWIEFLRSGLDPFTGYAQISQDRIVRYNDYDLMDQYSDIATALDIYAEESSQPDPRKKRVAWVDTEKAEIKEAGRKWLSTIRAEDRVFALARNVAKYGDTFEYNLVNQNGIYNLQFIHPSRVNRIEADKLLGFQCDELARLMMRTGVQAAPEGRYFTPWDFLHFRIEAYDRETIYGRSLIENVRKTWKELQILETMVAVFRVTKSVERNIFIVDVSNSSPQEAQAQLEKWRQHLRKQQFIDPQTGDFRIDAQAITPQEDLILPIRGADNKTRVEKLQPSPDIGALKDLDYFRTKLRTALGIPQSYFDQTLEGTGWNSKEALVMQDQRFSRKITRIQRAVKSGLTRGLAVHLTLLGIKWEPGDFKIEMAPVNQITERLKEEWWLRRGELLNTLLPVAVTANFDQEEWNKIIINDLLPLSPSALKKLLTPSPEQLALQNPQPAAPGGAAGGAGGAQGGKPGAPKQQTAKVSKPGSGGKVGKFATFAEPDKAEDADAIEMLSDFFAGNPEIQNGVRAIVENMEERQRYEVLERIGKLKELRENMLEEAEESKALLYDFKGQLTPSVQKEMKERAYLAEASEPGSKALALRKLRSTVYLGDQQIKLNERFTPEGGINKVTVPMDFGKTDRKR